MSCNRVKPPFDGVRRCNPSAGEYVHIESASTKGVILHGFLGGGDDLEVEVY
jgi:hypothetical protein